MEIHVSGKGKDFGSYYLSLIGKGDKYSYREKFYCNKQIIDKYYYLLKKIKSKKGKLKLYNELKKLSDNIETKKFLLNGD